MRCYQVVIATALCSIAKALRARTHIYTLDNAMSSCFSRCIADYGGPWSVNDPVCICVYVHDFLFLGVKTELDLEYTMWVLVVGC